jgi:TonB family protein
LCHPIVLHSQNPDPKELPANKGNIVGQNLYNNPTLGLSLSLPGAWQFFDRTAYSTPEQKQHEKEMLEKARATCQGALCGPVDIDVSLQSPSGGPPKYAIYLSAHKLAPDYQDRSLHPLRKFAEVMSFGSLGNNWIPDGELTSINLGGRPAYRLVVHNSQTTAAKGFLYVADSNGQVFMLLGVAMSEPATLQSALEGLRFTDSPASSTIGQASSVEAYPNTVEGLHRLLNDLLLTAKNDDEAKLQSQIAEMEITSYENWFTSTFGQEKGQPLASTYGRFLKVSESQFQVLWAELAKQGGEILIEKVDTARRYGMAVGALDEYTAHWKKTDASEGPSMQSIGLFDFVDGKFRLREFLHEVRIVSTNKAGAPPPARPTNVTPGKLISRVQPVYPEAARKLRIQGMVALNVLLRKDGTVTVQNVGAGHPLLAPAAVAAVQQWRYEPTRVDGEPVETETKVYVTFELNRQQGEQK